MQSNFAAFPAGIYKFHFDSSCPLELPRFDRIQCAYTYFDKSWTPLHEKKNLLSECYNFNSLCDLLRNFLPSIPNICSETATIALNLAKLSLHVVMLVAVSLHLQLPLQLHVRRRFNYQITPPPPGPRWCWPGNECLSCKCFASKSANQKKMVREQVSCWELDYHFHLKANDTENLFRSQRQLPINDESKGNRNPSNFDENTYSTSFPFNWIIINDHSKFIIEHETLLLSCNLATHQHP